MSQEYEHLNLSQDLVLVSCSFSPMAWLLDGSSASSVSQAFLDCFSTISTFQEMLGTHRCRKAEGKECEEYRKEFMPVIAVAVLEGLPRWKK